DFLILAKMFDADLLEFQIIEVRTETPNVLFIAVGRGFPPVRFLIFVPYFGGHFERKRCEMRITASHISSFSDPYNRTYVRRFLPMIFIPTHIPTGWEPCPRAKY